MIAGIRLSGVLDGPVVGAPSLHECRSLAERLYRAQGIDTQTLLGHSRPQQTDDYNDDRGLSSGQWKVLVLPGQPEYPAIKPPGAT